MIRIVLVYALIAAAGALGMYFDLTQPPCANPRPWSIGNETLGASGTYCPR